MKYLLCLVPLVIGFTIIYLDHHENAAYKVQIITEHHVAQNALTAMGEATTIIQSLRRQHVQDARQHVQDSLTKNYR